VARDAEVAKQRRTKHTSAPMNQCSPIEEMLKAVFSKRSFPMGYEWDKFGAELNCKLVCEVKARLGWGGMAAGLGVSQLKH
jgi:hypothetical protein